MENVLQYFQKRNMSTDKKFCSQTGNLGKEIKSQVFPTTLIEKYIQKGEITREGDFDDDEWIHCEQCCDFVTVEGGNKCKHKDTCDCSDTICPDCFSVVRTVDAWLIMEEEGYFTD